MKMKSLRKSQSASAYAFEHLRSGENRSMFYHIYNLHCDSWLTDDNTLELPDRIEEVNLKMLQKTLDTQEHVVVFFYNAEDKKSQKILQHLENIDDEVRSDFKLQTSTPFTYEN